MENQTEFWSTVVDSTKPGRATAHTQNAPPPKRKLIERRTLNLRTALTFGFLFWYRLKGRIVLVLNFPFFLADTLCSCF